MSRELTRKEKTAIRSLVVTWCANYDREYGCLPLDSDCYMLGKCWTGSYCRYFRESVLPLDPALEASLMSAGPRPDFKICPVCSVNMGKCVGAEPEPEPAPEPEPEPEKPGNAGMILLVLAVMGIGGGAAWYFKIYRPKHQQADQPEEDDGGEYQDYDEFEHDGPPWDEEDETEEKEEIR